MDTSAVQQIKKRPTTIEFHVICTESNHQAIPLIQRKSNFLSISLEFLSTTLKILVVAGAGWTMQMINMQQVPVCVAMEWHS